MSTEQRPPSPPPQAPEIAPELLSAPSFGDYNQLEPGQSFRLYYDSGPRFIEAKPGRPVDRGLQSQYMDFHRLDPDQWCPWMINAADMRMGVILDGSTTYDRSSILGGVVKARGFFTFRRVEPRKLKIVAPDGDSLVITGTEVKGKFNIGPILGVEWPWGKVTVDDVPEN